MALIMPTIDISGTPDQSGRAGGGTLDSSGRKDTSGTSIFADATCVIVTKTGVHAYSAGNLTSAKHGTL